MEIETRQKYFLNGNLSTEYSYVNNVMHDLQKWYYENGQLNRVFYYKSGKLHRMNQDFDNDGKMEYVTQLKYPNDDQNMVGDAIHHGPIIKLRYGN